MPEIVASSSCGFLPVHLYEGDLEDALDKYDFGTGTAKVYTVRARKTYGGWAVATVREWDEGGSLDVQSDYGNFAYSWGRIGQRGMLKFLTKISFEYFMNKARADNGRGRRFDFDKTIADIKQSLIELRRDGSLDKQQLRERVEDLDGLEHTDNAELFCERLMSRCDWAYEWADYQDPCSYVDDPQCRAFWEGPWQALCAHWRAEALNIARAA